MQLIIALIRKNQNGGGANIEVVISRAADRGIYRDHILNDIQHLKFEGHIFEPKEAVQQLLSVANLLLLFRFKGSIHLLFLLILNYWTASKTWEIKSTL